MEIKKNQKKERTIRNSAPYRDMVFTFLLFA